MLNGMFHRMLGTSLYDAFIVSVAGNQQATYFSRIQAGGTISFFHLYIWRSLVISSMASLWLHAFAYWHLGTGSIALASCILLYFTSALFFGGKAFEAVFISPRAKNEARGPKSCEDLGIYFSLQSPVTSRIAAAERSWFDIAYSIPYY
jgi:hypothetical protein